MFVKKKQLNIKESRMKKNKTIQKVYNQIKITFLKKRNQKGIMKERKKMNNKLKTNNLNKKFLRNKKKNVVNQIRLMTI